MKRESCPVCDGSGFIFFKQRVGELQRTQEARCHCWGCKGRGFVEYDAQSVVSMTESTLGSIVTETFNG